MIQPAQLLSPYIKPQWNLPLGVVESLVVYNCRKYGMPRPVLAVPFWEGAGNKAYDVSGYGNHGTLVGQPDWVADGLGSALSLNGGGDYINAGNSTSLNFNDVDFSFGLWFRPRNIVSVQVLMAKFENVYDNYDIRINSSQVQFYLRDSNGQSPGVENIGSLTANMLYYVIVTVDQTNEIARSYLNGVPGGTADLSTIEDISPSGNLLIGTQTGSSVFFNGITNIPTITPAAYTPTQVKFSYDNPYWMYEIPEELYGYSASVSPVELGTALMEMLV